MFRQGLERYQLWIYLIALGVGTGVGKGYATLAPVLEQSIWLTLTSVRVKRTGEESTLDG